MAAAAAVFAIMIGSSARAATAPRADIASFAELVGPLPYPYDPQADADPAAVEAKIGRARAPARRQHKLLLVDFGGNWCADRRILMGGMDLPNIKAFIDAHYVELMVDCGRRIDQNLQVADHYGVAHVVGVPSLFIVEPRSDRLIDVGETAGLADARYMSPQGLADWLARRP